MTSYSEFESRILNRNHKKKFKVSNSWGAYDAYKYIRKNGWYNIGRPLKEGEFYSIIREVNNLIAVEISKGNTVMLPSRMGKLELRRREAGASIVDGKLKITYPINWKKTLKLWYSDAEERKKKTVVRDNEKSVYRVHYNKYQVNCENIGFYEFSLNRAIKLALKDNINKRQIDTLW